MYFLIEFLRNVIASADFLHLFHILHKFQRDSIVAGYYCAQTRHSERVYENPDKHENAVIKPFGGVSAEDVAVADCENRRPVEV